MAKKVVGEDGKVYKVKKPLYKRAWFWFLVVAVAFIATGLQGGSNDSKNTTKESVSEVSSTEPTASEKENKISQEENVPREHRNALAKAQSYLSWAGMSEEGLRKQLAFEEYPSEAIDYALANVEVDYNEQALTKAKSYDNWASMSDSRLYDQLKFEGFTDEQAQYALDNLPQQ